MGITFTLSESPKFFCKLWFLLNEDRFHTIRKSKIVLQSMVSTEWGSLSHYQKLQNFFARSTMVTSGPSVFMLPLVVLAYVLWGERHSRNSPKWTGEQLINPQEKKKCIVSCYWFAKLLPKLHYTEQRQESTSRVQTGISEQDRERPVHKKMGILNANTVLVAFTHPAPSTTPGTYLEHKKKVWESVEWKNSMGAVEFLSSTVKSS